MVRGFDPNPSGSLTTNIAPWSVGQATENGHTHDPAGVKPRTPVMPEMATINQASHYLGNEAS